MLLSFRPLFLASRVRLLVYLLTSLGLALQAEISRAEDVGNWPTSWKPSAQAKIIVAQKGNGNQPYTYHTQNYELHSLTALNTQQLQAFANITESIPHVLKRLPMPLLGMPEGRRAKVLIYPDEDSFIAAGGVPGAAGYYNGRMKAILLRADSFLTPASGRGSRLPPKADYSLLVHEFTHLCMHNILGYLPPWFSEGTAEYITAAHQSKGVYQFSNPSSSIRKRIRKALPNDKDEIILPSISETMALSHKQWGERIKKGQPNDLYRSYATSLLIVHTLFHGGEKRREATRTFLKTQQQRPHRMDQETRIVYPRWDEAEAILISPEERKKLQQRIIEYWRPRGLRLKFNFE